MEHIHTEGNDVLEHSDNRREAGKCHKQEEQRSPDPAACHIHEYVWQCDEDQTRTGTDFHAIAETCREDDQSCHDCDKCIKCTDTDALPGERIVLAHIASEDLHRRNTQTQSEERLVHSRRDHISKTDLGYGFCIWYKVELQAFLCTG